MGGCCGLLETDALPRLAGITVGDLQFAVLAAADGGHLVDPSARPIGSACRAGRCGRISARPRPACVNLDDSLISQPDAGEQALEIADTLVRSGAVDVLVIDLVAALVPRAELEGEMGDSHLACRPG